MLLLAWQHSYDGKWYMNPALHYSYWKRDQVFWKHCITIVPQTPHSAGSLRHWVRPYCITIVSNFQIGRAFDWCLPHHCATLLPPDNIWSSASRHCWAHQIRTIPSQTTLQNTGKQMKLKLSRQVHVDAVKTSVVYRHTFDPCLPSWCINEALFLLQRRSGLTCMQVGHDNQGLFTL